MCHGQFKAMLVNILQNETLHHAVTWLIVYCNDNNKQKVSFDNVMKSAWCNNVETSCYNIRQIFVFFCLFCGSTSFLLHIIIYCYQSFHHLLLSVWTKCIITAAGTCLLTICYSKVTLTADKYLKKYINASTELVKTCTFWVVGSKMIVLFILNSDVLWSFMSQSYNSIFTRTSLHWCWS